ncbi:MAG TPA: recombinase family protein [Rugosimonospora sp.]|nr:recombinase family protein [Rugosimonospora sp.]
MSGKLFDEDFEWILYDRISDDRGGLGLGVKRQEKEGSVVVDRLGGRVYAVCCDNDLTANTRSKRYRPRPDYGRMVALLQERPGRRGVIAWHTDRLHRTPRELEDFIDVVEQTGAPVYTTKAGPIDLTTASGRMVARQLCAVARFESEHKADRIRSKVVELATEGKIANGGPRPFGFTRIYAGEGPRRKILRDEINEVEATIIRECAARVLAGEPIYKIVGDLNKRGITSSSGRPWSKQAMRTLLMSGRIAGLREHNRQVVGPAVWPAIIDEETHKRLRALLAAKQRPPGSRVKIHYLSGFVYCSDCAGRDVAMRVGRFHRTTLRYSCPAKSEGGCGGRVICLDDLRGFIDRFMEDRLNDPQTLREIAQREAREDHEAARLVAAIEADERRLALLQPQLADGDEEEIPEVLATVRTLRKRVAQARTHLAHRAGVPALAGESLPDLAKRWPDLPLQRKQALLSLFVYRILIKPARRGLNRFDPDRVVLIPRDATPAA